MKSCVKTNDVLLDQYYTRHHVAQKLYGILHEYVDLSRYQLVEPSAGTGSFFRLMPQGSLAFDVDPKYPGIAPLISYLLKSAANERWLWSAIRLSAGMPVWQYASSIMLHGRRVSSH